MSQPRSSTSPFPASQPAVRNPQPRRKRRSPEAREAGVGRTAPTTVKGSVPRLHRRGPAVKPASPSELMVSSAAVLVIGHDGALLSVTDTARRVAGWPARSRLRGRLLDLVHPDDRRKVLRRISYLRSGIGATCSCVVRVRSATGTYRHLQVTATNHFNAPAVGGIALTIQDVTKAAVADAALRRSQQLALKAEALAHMGSWEWRRDEKWPAISDELWRIVGLKPGVQHSRPSSILRRVHPDDAERVRRAVLRSFRRGLSLDLHFRIVRPNGDVRKVHAVGEAQGRPGARCSAMVGMCLDITDLQDARDQLQLKADILRNIREGVVVTGLDGRITYWNDAASQIFGYSSQQMLGETLNKLYPGHALATDALAPILEGGEYLGEQQAQRPDGTLIWVAVRASALRDGQDRPIGAIAVATEVTERRATADRLMRLEAAVEQASDSVVIANANAQIEYVNPAFERITGYRRQDVIGKNPRILKSGLQPDSFYRAMWSTLTAGQPFAADFTNRREDGSLFEEEATISPIRDNDGEITGYVAVKRDVTSERSLQTHAERLLRERVLIADTIRGITGRETPEETAQAISRQVASMTEVATAGLFIFELDGRTAPYGFVVASGAMPTLRRVQRRRTAYLRERANEGPWIEPWADRPWHPYNEVFMRHGVRGIAYAPVRDNGSVIGFLHISSPATNWQEQLTEQMPALVEFAEIAGTLIGPSVAERTEIAAVRAAIRRVVSEVAFRPVFQPIVDLHTGSVVGYEALTRFDDGTAPDVKFAEAQEVGMGARLEIATLQAALEAARELPDYTWLNLNASPQLILAGPRLQELLAPERREIVLEVTEHVAIADYGAFRTAIGRLGPNIRIAIDDAGAGYSSLHHILELAPSIVKLDRAIVTGLEGDRARTALVAGMQHFARSTGIRLIAEGVETQGELEALRRLDVDLAQGYLLGRPAPAGGVGRGLLAPRITQAASAAARLSAQRSSKVRRAAAIA